MDRLKAAIETLESSLSRLEKNLASRLSAMEDALRLARTEAAQSTAKAKNTDRVSARLDDVINQLENILGQGKGNR